MARSDQGPQSYLLMSVLKINVAPFPSFTVVVVGNSQVSVYMTIGPLVIDGMNRKIQGDLCSIYPEDFMCIDGA